MAATSEGTEQALGVLSQLGCKLTAYDVLFTNLRLVAVKIGAAPVAELAGMMNGTAGSSPAGPPTGGTYPSRAIDRLLAAHPKNFEVRYDRVTRARFNAGSAWSRSRC